MKLRIAYYVVALAISLAAVIGAYGYAADARDAADAVYDGYAVKFQNPDSDCWREPGCPTRLATMMAENAYDAAARRARVAYGMAAAVSLAAFAGAYILSQKAA